MKFLIISGMSGAGKTRTADILEDMDYYCVDNMPAALLPKLAEFCRGMGSRYEKVALVTDIRDAGGADAIFDSLDKLWELGCEYEILYVEADMSTLIKRYKESRRPHPLLSEAGTIEVAVRLEAQRLERLRDSADYVINTSALTLGQLQAEIFKLFGRTAERGILVKVMSFGFKHGIPLEADMVLDARFLPNPYYVAELREKTGLDREVEEFIFQYDTAREFLQRLKDMMVFLIPQYIEEGKHTLTVAVGCTGGHHRSVAVANALCGCITELGHRAELVNRDIEK